MNWHVPCACAHLCGKGLFQVTLFTSCETCFLFSIRQGYVGLGLVVSDVVPRGLGKVLLPGSAQHELTHVPGHVYLCYGLRLRTKG